MKIKLFPKQIIFHKGLNRNHFTQNYPCISSNIFLLDQPHLIHLSLFTQNLLQFNTYDKDMNNK